MTETKQHLPMFRYSPLGQRLMKEAAPKLEAADPLPTPQHDQPPHPQASPSSSKSVLLLLSAAGLLGYLSYRNLRDL